MCTYICIYSIICCVIVHSSTLYYMILYYITVRWHYAEARLTPRDTQTTFWQGGLLMGQLLLLQCVTIC